MRTIEQHAQALADGTHHQPRAGGTMPGAHRRSGRRRRARLHQGACRAGTRDGGCDGHAAPRRPRTEPLRRHSGRLKDLFDIAGEPTPAGSRVLADAPPATAHAPVVQRMLAAGFVPMGRTNMTEFAFSGLGINPHYGTPRSPWDRAAGRIPGGSSSGTAVSVADGMAVGRPRHRHRRILPHPGGVLRHRRLQADRAARADRRRAAAGAEPRFGRAAGAERRLLRGDRCGAGRRSAGPAGAGDARRAAPRGAGELRARWHGRQRSAAHSTGRSPRCRAAGARIVRTRFPEFDEIPAVNAKGGFAASEAYAWHRALLAEKGARLRSAHPRAHRARRADDRRRLPRPAWRARQRLIASFDARTRDFDALVMPTVPIVPPRIADLDDEREYNRINLLHPAQHRAGQFLRSLRDQPAVPSRRASRRSD